MFYTKLKINLTFESLKNKKRKKGKSYTGADEDEDADIPISDKIIPPKNTNTITVNTMDMIIMYFACCL